MKRYAAVSLIVAALALAIGTVHPKGWTWVDHARADECTPSQYHPCEEHPPPCVDNQYHHCPTAVTDVAGFRVRNGVATWQTSTELGLLGFWLYRPGCRPVIHVDAYGDALPHSYRVNVSMVAGKCKTAGAHRWHLQTVRGA